MKVESSVLKRLGPVPFWRGERRCLDALGEVYRRAQESACRVLSVRGAGAPNASHAKAGGR